MDRFFEVRIVCVYNLEVVAAEDKRNEVRNEKVTVKAENAGHALERALRFFRPDDYRNISVKQVHVLCD